MSDHFESFPSGAWDGAEPGELAEPTRADAPVRFDLHRLLDAMPRLGTVLWLERRDRRAAARVSGTASEGVLLVEHPALGVLSRCTRITAHSAVTCNGPREWLCFHDAAGVGSKLYLLPDTDYLAWDEMTAASRLLPPAAAPARDWQAHGALLRNAFARLGVGWRARLLEFDLKRMPWLRTLGARPPLRISLIGLELARAIASDEGAEWVTPLHTA